MSSSDRISSSSIDLVELARRAADESDRHFLNVVRAMGSGARRTTDSFRFVVGKAADLGAKLRRPAWAKTILDLLREDQTTISKAGDFIDREFFDALKIAREMPANYMGASGHVRRRPSSWCAPGRAGCGP